MTVLVVAAGLASPVETALAECDVRHVTSVSAAMAVIEDDLPEAILVDGPVEGCRSDGTDDDALGRGGADAVAAVVDAVRSAAVVVPVVVVGADPDAEPTGRPVDELVVRPFEPAALRAAVDRALLVAEYDRTIERLFDAAQSAADGESGRPELSPELRRLRREADDLLDDVVGLEAPDLLVALVGEPGDEDQSTAGVDA